MERKIIVDANGELVASDVNLEALMTRIEVLEKKVFSLTNQLDHQIPRINDIEDKIDWSKKGKI